MANITSLCVFCGSQVGQDARHVETARNLGQALADRGITLVYGGGGIGLMKEVADTVLKGGGHVVGVIPEHLARVEVQHAGVTELLRVGSMHERKQIMFERSDGFVVMPGGFGTLDEFFEVLTWRQIGLHDKPTVILDETGYWQPLRALLDHVANEKFAGANSKSLYSFAPSIKDLFASLEAAPEPKSAAPGDKL